MSQLRRGVGTDLCGRVHAVTGVECYLADTHYPAPHRSMDGDSWHDGLCSQCAGGGTWNATPCPRCNTTGFEPLPLPNSDTQHPG